MVKGYVLVLFATAPKDSRLPYDVPQDKVIHIGYHTRPKAFDLAKAELAKKKKEGWKIHSAHIYIDAGRID